MVTRKDAPVLPDWVSLADLSRMLGISKQAVHRMADLDRFETLHRFGQRPDYVLSRAEAESLVTAKRSRNAAGQVPADPGS